MPTTSSSSRVRYPSTKQFSSFQETARTKHRGLGRVLTAAGYSQIEGTTGRDRKHWTR